MTNQTPKSRMHYGLKAMASLCRGNTLVPIIIALSISSVATVAFLKQGADLSEKQKQINAPKEAFEYLQEWVNLRKQKQFHYQITPAELSFHNTQNVLGYSVQYEQGSATKNSKFVYPAQSGDQCIRLKSMIEKYGSVRKISCRCHSSNPNPNCSQGKYLNFEFSR